MITHQQKLKSRQNLYNRVLTVWLQLLYPIPSPEICFVITFSKYNRIYLSLLAVNHYTYSISISMKWKTLAFQLWYIIFYVVCFLHHLLPCICYGSSTVGDCNIYVSYAWPDIHWKYAARFYQDIL